MVASPVPHHPSALYDQLCTEAAVSVGTFSFAPFPHPIPGFSWLRHLLEGNDPHGAAAADARARARDLLIEAAPEGPVHRVWDLGCGFGADLRALAARFPQARLTGHTLSRRQADAAREANRAAGLQARIHITHGDAHDHHPSAPYDLIWAFETLCHVPEQGRLLRHAAQHLTPAGRLLSADFVVPGRSPVNHAPAAAYLKPVSAWVDHLNAADVHLTRVIDLSPQVAHFLQDPTFARRLEDLVARRPALAAAAPALRAFHNLGVLLQKGRVRYLLLAARKRAPGDGDLNAVNRTLLTEPAVSSTLVHQIAPLRPARRRAALVALVQQKLSDLLQEDTPPDPETGFHHLGLGSTAVVVLLSGLEQDLQLSLPVTTLYTYPTISQFATFLSEEIQHTPGEAP